MTNHCIEGLMKEPVDSYADYGVLPTTCLLDENRNYRASDLEEIYLNPQVKTAEAVPKSPHREDWISTMATVRSFLQSRKQYLPTILLLICVTIYLPYSYVSVLHAREQHLNELQTSSGFHKVANRSHVLFSAYLDDRFPNEPAKLRILGFKSKQDERPLYCKLYLKNTTAVCLSNPAIELRLDPKDDSSLDTQGFFHCTLPESITEMPVAVTLSSSPKCQMQDHVPVPVNPVQGDPKEKQDIVVCFAVPAGEFTNEQDYRALIEILEMSRLFGASSVQMYNKSMNHILQRILEPYIKSGFLVLHPWNIGDRYLPHSARTLSNNDCIYRNIAKFRNIVFLDRNEIIIPSQGYNASWAKIIRQMNQVYPGSGAFWFQRVQYVSEEALPIGFKAIPLPEKCPLSRIPKSDLPRIFTHRFLTKYKNTNNSQIHYSQAILDPSSVLYVDTQMRISFLPGKSAKFLTSEVGQSVNFVNYKLLDNKKSRITHETFRSINNVVITKELYNRLGYAKKLDLSACVITG